MNSGETLPKFLEHCKKLKSRPKVVSKDNMAETAFEGFLENGLNRFKDSNDSGRVIVNRETKDGVVLESKSGKGGRSRQTF
jgi:hypothetical protein